MRKIENLQSSALNFWPQELTEIEKNSSIIPLLIDTQDKFISLLNIADANPSAWIETLSTSKSLPPNLFLKHLMVLSDIGGERLMRFKTELPSILDGNQMEFSWEGESHIYKFKSLGDNKAWNNKNLYVDGDNLIVEHELNDMIEDVAMLLLYGGAVLIDDIPNEIEEKCIIGTLLGKKEELDTFVRQRYIWVSRITGGAKANSMGQLAQNYVGEYLKEKLPTWDFNHKNIPDISQNDGRTPIGFDIVAISPNEKYFAIEVSFQVTTNSTIERKAGQARTRINQLHRKGHKIIYVIDGAGNFERRSALNTISRYSDAIVTFKSTELDSLVQFLIENEKEK